MTICVAVCVYDGIVFAADSATSLIGVDQAGNATVDRVYQHGVKLFNLDKRCPIIAMTNGMGSIGAVPIHFLAKELRRQFKTEGNEFSIDLEKYAISDVVELARKFLFEEKYSSLNPPISGPHSLEFWIGGYSCNSSQIELKVITIENGQCRVETKVDGGVGGVFWAGQPAAINRLLGGFDDTLAQGLKAAGVAENELPQLCQFLQTYTVAPMWHPAMPIQDAIELADFLVATTKGFVRFLPGADTVGGQTDIAVVTKHEKFKWIRRKHYYASELNRETDHV